VTTKLVSTENAPTERIDSDVPIELGQWFWLTEEGKTKHKHLCCVTHVGSNYAELSNLWESEERIAFGEEWAERCEYEPDPKPFIARQIAASQNKAQLLLQEVQRITVSLGCAPREALADRSMDAGQAQTLAIAHGTADIDAHKKALIKAKTETLPGLFKQIEEAHKIMAAWMQIETLPSKAQLAMMEQSIDTIDDRIFTVSIYAGLAETLEKIADGAPAPNDTKVTLFQRRHYMDEECLANYSSGGMDFSSIDKFEEWLCKPENRSRILPLQRCIVAFRVRRNRKERDGVSLGDWIRIQGEDAADKTTYLYVRNGEQVWRLRTQIEFDEQLFPDREHESLLNQTEPLWADVSWGSIEERRVITHGQHEHILFERARKTAEYKAELAVYKDALKIWNALPKKERETYDPNQPEWYRKLTGGLKPEADRRAPQKPWDDSIGRHDKYERVTPDSVYYDDVMQLITKIAAKHNRMAVVLQGLLDRSPCLHPHPPWRIWTPEGFASGIDLIYDDSRALTDGEAIDFEVYRTEINRSIKVGTHTIGQEDFWELAEGEKECERRDRASYRSGSSDYRPERARPYGNPGPGLVAKVASMSRNGDCTYEWKRKRTTYSHRDSELLNARIKVPKAKLFNVDAYTPGDYKLFFADPRTRAEYLQWAPFLLAAEDWHAGKRTDPEEDS